MLANLGVEEVSSPLYSALQRRLRSFGGSSKPQVLTNELVSYTQNPSVHFPKSEFTSPNYELFKSLK